MLQTKIFGSSELFQFRLKLLQGMGFHSHHEDGGI